MKKIAAIALAILLPTVVLAATFNQFKPVTGVLKGNASTYVTTAATSADIRGLWSGTCDATTFLRGDGACATAGGATGANPTATVGTSATNGVATTFMRSDAAPGVNLAMTPTWTGLHTFSNSLTVSSGALNIGGSFSITTGGTATLLRALLSTGVYIAGTKYTTTGCSVSATTGGATAGVFTLGANTCSVVVTFGTGTLAAANGWTCQAHDKTAPATVIGGESASSTSTATFTIPAGAGATDVISFSCMAY